MLQACTVTSGLMAALGLIIRKVESHLKVLVFVILTFASNCFGYLSQASHVASTEGLPVPDCSTDIPCNISKSRLCGVRIIL